MSSVQKTGGVPPHTIAVDFDGTICDWDFPNIGPPKAGVREALTLFRHLGYKIIIWSCRTSLWNEDIFGELDGAGVPIERKRVKEMIQFLNDNDIPFDEVDDGTKGKPLADWYIDDRAIRFQDNWHDIALQIKARADNFILIRQFIKLKQ